MKNKTALMVIFYLFGIFEYSNAQSQTMSVFPSYYVCDCVAEYDSIIDNYFEGPDWVLFDRSNADWVFQANEIQSIYQTIKDSPDCLLHLNKGEWVIVRDELGRLFLFPPIVPHGTYLIQQGGQMHNGVYVPNALNRIGVPGVYNEEDLNVPNVKILFLDISNVSGW
jgi:hypothetical protein